MAKASYKEAYIVAGYLCNLVGAFEDQNLFAEESEAIGMCGFIDMFNEAVAGYGISIPGARKELLKYLKEEIEN